MLHKYGILLILITAGFFVAYSGDAGKFIFPKLRYFPPVPEFPENPMRTDGVELGRYLFYDPILSRDSSISCSSCHQQKYAFTSGPVDFATGISGKEMRRNTMPLFNLVWTPAYFWDGRVITLEDQVLHPLRNPDEMDMSFPELLIRLNRSTFYNKKFYELFGNTSIDSVSVARVLSQFLRSLISYRSRFDLAVRGERILTPDEIAGFEIALDNNRGACSHCHPMDGNLLTTDFGFVSNGLDTLAPQSALQDLGRFEFTRNPADKLKFRTPSLRNLVFTAPYMHDGRFKTLEEVIEFYSTGVHAGPFTDSRMVFASQKGAGLQDHEKKQLLLFLHTLTDSALVMDPQHKNPNE